MSKMKHVWPAMFRQDLPAQPSLVRPTPRLRTRWSAGLALCGLLCCGFAGAADMAAEAPAAVRSADTAIPTGFKVRRLLKTDDTHYWADWANTCPFIIDQVYVMVRFLDGSRKPLGNGVWPMYFILPGAHRVTRFSIPAGAVGFESIRVRRITTNTLEALR